MPEGSYTTYLFEKGLNKILKKVGEESAETIIAAKDGDDDALKAETADLLYHLVVMLVERGLTLEDVGRELARRRKGGE
jgi:phosphoribosyl-AMP cyclohydrolase / phosphoribosyl-ATP pyrophosphohydrolase